MNQGKYLKNGLFSIQKCVDDVCDFVSLCGPQRRHEEPQNDFFSFSKHHFHLEVN